MRSPARCVTGVLPVRLLAILWGKGRARVREERRTLNSFSYFGPMGVGRLLGPRHVDMLDSSQRHWELRSAQGVHPERASPNA